MAHYFTNDRSLRENRKVHSFRFSGHLFQFTTDVGVFSKKEVDQGTEILLKTLEQEPLEGKVLDLGCGYGVIGIVLKTIFPGIDLTMVDINERAIELTQINIDSNNMEANAFVSDGFEKIHTTFHVVITNPPIRAGKKVIYALFQDAYEHLEVNGNFYCVIRKNQGAASAQKELERLFGNCECIEKDKGYWILRSKKSS